MGNTPSVATMETAEPAMTTTSTTRRATTSTPCSTTNAAAAAAAATTTTTVYHGYNHGNSISSSVARLNNRLSFDFGAHLLERNELAQEFRRIATHAAAHRQRQGSWQVLQGTTSVVSGLAAAGLALVASGALAGTAGVGVVAIPAWAAVLGNSVTAASLASSAAAFGYGHVVDKDIARQLHNLYVVLQSAAQKEKEINKVIADKTESNGDGAEKEKSPVRLCTACTKLCQVWNDWNLAAKQEKRVEPFDLAMALVKSHGVILGTHSIVKGSQTSKQAYNDFEMTLVQTADWIDEETKELQKHHRRMQYLPCLPPERQLPRGRLRHVNGGGGHVDMVVTYDHPPTGLVDERIQSDSTQCLRLPEGATNVKVQFKDRSGKLVRKVDRKKSDGDAKDPNDDGKGKTKKSQPLWIKNDQDASTPVIEEICMDKADGMNVVLLVKGDGLTYAYIAKAWNFGYAARQSAVATRLDWEYWPQAEMEIVDLLPTWEREQEQQRAFTVADDEYNFGLCCYYGAEDVFAPIAAPSEKAQ